MMSKLTFQQADVQNCSKAYFDKLFPRVTRDMVDAWLTHHRSHLATFSNGARKGVYHKGLYPATSYTPMGRTWREVLCAFVVTQEE